MNAAVRPIPAGHESLIPHLVCGCRAEAIDFYNENLRRAEEVHR